MTYSSIHEMATSSSLQQRIAAAAAQEGVAEPPVGWAANHSWQLASSPEWASNWTYAVEQSTVNDNPDTGARTDVISDQMILSAVQAAIAAENPTE